MKKGEMAVLVSIALVLVALTGAAPALAAAPRGVTGGAHYTFSKDGGLTSQPGWLTVSVREINSETGEARGYYHWWTKGKAYGRMMLRVKITCIKFVGDGEVEISGRVVKQIGLGWPDCAAYQKMWLRDGGTPASAGDEGAVFLTYCAAAGWYVAGYSCDPCGDPDGCPALPPDPGKLPKEIKLSFPMEGGNLVVHD